MKEYRHVVIDKAGVGLATLRQSLDQAGLETAQQRGIQLATGSVRLEHHLNVFLWDDTTAGQKGYINLILAGNCVAVKVRWTTLTEPGIIFSGTLQGDNGHNGPPQGKSTNGAWAYKGSIPRNYCFIEGVDTEQTPGYAKWKSGTGWQ
ncbi:hypothetical protein ACPA5B_12340 [Pseudomonas solani]|uniref:hypothetical protein n=1 Tax=Pseudomonas TaxID=286 RepID=UPI0029279A48|nr:hypothetical protein [Pseudomonas sp. zfem005]MDU9412163.1 hypothetical protein [Pseudomonas sp. zfem005]